MTKVVVVYLSTSGNTKAMAADAIAIGSSTFHYKILPPMEKFIDSLGKANVSGKPGAAFGSYGWSGEAPVLIAEKMREIGMKVNSWINEQEN